MRRVRTGPSCIAPVFDKYLSPRRYHSSEQVTVDFTGSPSSQEINGTFAAVSCDLVLSPASVSTLGNGHTCQFVSGSSLKVPEHVLFAFQGLLDFRCEGVKRIVAGLRWSRIPPLQALGRACTCTEGGREQKNMRAAYSLLKIGKYLVQTMPSAHEADRFTVYIFADIHQQHGWVLVSFTPIKNR